MADQADVRSIDAVREWHAALTGYGETLAEAMAGVELELRRANDWLYEQVGRWQRAIRECEQQVVQAKAELAARKFPDWSGREPDTTVQEKALRQARARLEHAEDQVEKVRAWIGRLPKMIDEVYRGPAHRLVNFLEAELPKGLAVLGQRITALETYAGLRTDYAPGPSVSSLPAAKVPPGADAPGSPKQDPPS
jgi:hypothetical protein